MGKAIRVGIILAGGGQGKRLREKLPKALIRIEKKTLFYYCLEIFHAVNEVFEIILTLPEGSLTSYATNKLKKTFPKLSEIVPGGQRRQDSVFAGLKALGETINIVLVHDTSRPLVSKTVIQAVIRETCRYGACIPVFPSRSTLKTVSGRFIKETVDRKNIFEAQTPQGFKKTLLTKAYKEAQEKDLTVSDDCMLFEQIHKKVYVVPGEARNIKITYPADLVFAESILNNV